MNGFQRIAEPHIMPPLSPMEAEETTA